MYLPIYFWSHSLWEQSEPLVRLYYYSWLLAHELEVVCSHVKSTFCELSSGSSSSTRHSKWPSVPSFNKLLEFKPATPENKIKLCTSQIKTRFFLVLQNLDILWVLPLRMMLHTLSLEKLYNLSHLWVIRTSPN